MQIHHTAIEVSDLEATREFYEDGLGLEFAWEFTTDEGVRNYYVTGPDLDSELQFVHDPDAEGPVEPSGLAHLALLVEDADAVFEQVVERTDCPVAMEPTTIEAADARAAFVEDPDGYEVEIFHEVD